MSASTSALTVENLRDHFLMPGRVVIAYDATKNRSELEFWKTFNSIKSQDDILQSGDTLVFLGVLHKIQHPLGYQMQASPGDFLGTTQIRVVEEEVSKKVDLYTKLLQPIAQECEEEGIDIEVKVAAGTPTRRVIVQELVQSNATWAVLDRHLRRDLKYYLEQIPCKIAFVRDDFSMEVVRPYATNEIDNIDHKLFSSMSKSEINDYSLSMSSLEHNLLSPNQETPGSVSKEGNTCLRSPEIVNKLRKKPEPGLLQRSSEAPVLCTGCGIKTEPDIKYAMSFRYSEIQLATDDLSKVNLIGEGGYGLVYKGKLKNGQLIAAKVRKEASFQGFAEFQSEIYVLNFARHKNIVMLLGYCCKENLNILVYEYICNKSLEWHLFENTESILEWHTRYVIAIGTAKGLRFLHEECRGSPIIHRDMRPSNILLTHDFVPVLGDFGLAKWITNEGNIQSNVLGTLGYLSPEYAENGTASIWTDVFSFGIVLIQLISGRKVFDSNRDGHEQSLRQWAVPLIQKLSLHELIDPRIQDSCDMYELYNMVRAAFLCVQTSPEMRPSMGQVLRLLEGEDDRFAQQFVASTMKYAPVLSTQ